MRTEYTEEERNELILKINSLQNEGKTLKEISEQLNINYNTCRAYAPKTNTKKIEIIREDFVRRYNNAKHTKKNVQFILANYYKVSQTKISDLYNQWEIPILEDNIERLEQSIELRETLFKQVKALEDYQYTDETEDPIYIEIQDIKKELEIEKERLQELESKKENPTDFREPSFITIVNSDPVRKTVNFIANSNDLPSYAKDLQRSSHLKTKFFESGKEKGIETTASGKHLIIKTTYNNISQKSAPTQKFFVFIMSKIVEQKDLSKDLFDNLSIRFSFEEIVKLGMYTGKNAKKVAVKSFKKCAEELQSIIIQGEYTKKTNKGETTEHYTKGTLQKGWGSRQLFHNIDVSNGIAEIQLNEELSWQEYTSKGKELMNLPDTYFSMSSKTSILFFNIFSLARTNAKKDSKDFSIKLKHIKTWLSLPDPNTTPNSYRDILEPIENAVSEINKKEHSKDFKLTLVYNRQEKNVVSILENGALLVQMKGAYTEKIEQIRTNRNIHIQTNKEKAKAKLKK